MSPEAILARAAERIPDGPVISSSSVRSGPGRAEAVAKVRKPWTRSSTLVIPFSDTGSLSSFLSG